jgi:hypothetical protein
MSSPASDRREDHIDRKRSLQEATSPDRPETFASIAARLGARHLFDAATTRDQRAIDRAKDEILFFASIARCPAFSEMLTAETALLGIERAGPHACGYIEAEFSARLALRRIIPELVWPCLVECGRG